MALVGYSSQPIGSGLQPVSNSVGSLVTPQSAGAHYALGGTTSTNSTINNVPNVSTCGVCDALGGNTLLLFIAIIGIAAVLFFWVL